MPTTQGRETAAIGQAEAKPVRLQLSRKKGFDLQAHSRAVNGLPAVSVARPGILGNPFVHATDPAQAVEAFDRLCRGGTQSFQCSPDGLHFAGSIHANALHWAWSEWLRDHGLPAIRGKNLACWCAVGSPCHADVLLRLANGPVCDDPLPTGADAGEGRHALAPSASSNPTAAREH
ncbi:hypothetical protein HNR00_003530 [Methylorubrum rhodinum]|uniref:DUF4326 domain-containing protein n=1 Tax=Methylorubrum rhodinum TaxID=29428 RepID=A0A840ZQ11_9HYPH|nr:DUF4326 domain-containing protein [Methylorubrum rhodinum]MBB5758803.1 hypothetical protein [Methylorubrum rhodinum]